MTDKEKILQFLTESGISKNSFYRKTGFSQGFLNSGRSIGVDKLKIIIDNYPEFDYAKILFGKPYRNKEKVVSKVADIKVIYGNKEIEKLEGFIKSEIQLIKQGQSEVLEQLEYLKKQLLNH